MRRTSTVTAHVGKLEHTRDQVLKLARVLRGGIDVHVAVFARNGERDLAFEIEMLLAADAQVSADALRAVDERGCAVVLAERVLGKDMAVGFERLVDRDVVLADRELELGEPRGAPRLPARLRDDGECNLPVELDAPVDEYRIVVHHGADVVRAGNVPRGQHRDDAGRGAHRIEVHAEQLTGCDRHAADRDMQQPFGLAHVVDEGRGAGDVLAAQSRAASSGARRAAAIPRSGGQAALTPAPSLWPTMRVSSDDCPAISFSALRSSARATSSR